MRLQRVSMIAAGLLLLATSSALARKWTDTTGKFSVEAEFVEIKGDKAVLKKSTGSVITVLIANLSKADQEHLQSLGKPGPRPPDNSPATQPAVVPQDEKLAADLKKGGIVSIRASGEPVGSVLAQIEKATGNRIRIVDEFGGDDKKILSKQVSLNLQGKPFWEAVEAVAAAAGVKFRAVTDGTLELSTEGPRFDKIRVIGAPTIAGAFQVYLGFDDFFGHAMVVVRPEPRFGEPQLRGYQAEITLPGGKQIQYKPNFLFSTSNVHTGELTLPIKDLPEGTAKAQEIKLDARLAIASDPKKFTLPPLAELAPKPLKVGGGTVFVTRAELASESSDRQMFAVELVAEGLNFDLKNVALVDTAGNRVTSSGGGSSKQNERQYVSLRFTVAKISGDPGKCQLAFEVPGTGEKTIGPLRNVAAKSVPAGATIVRITRANVGQQAGREEFEVKVEFDGFPASREQVTLVGEGAQPLEPRGWGGGGNIAQFWFDPAQIRGKAESYRLRLQAPTKVTEHVLRATFGDVPLTK